MRSLIVFAGERLEVNSIESIWLAHDTLGPCELMELGLRRLRGGLSRIPAVALPLVTATQATWRHSLEPFCSEEDLGRERPRFPPFSPPRAGLPFPLRLPWRPPDLERLPPEVDDPAEEDERLDLDDDDDRPDAEDGRLDFLRALGL